MKAVCRKCKWLVVWPAGSTIDRAAPKGSRLADWRCACKWRGSLRAYRRRDFVRWDRARKCVSKQLSLPGVKL